MKLEQWAVNTWVGIDIGINGLMGGDYRQTLSDRIGDKVRDGRLWARTLDRIFAGHFSDTDEDSRGKLLIESSVFLGLLSALFLLWIYAGFRWPVYAMRIQQGLLSVLLGVILFGVLRHRGKL